MSATYLLTTVWAFRLSWLIVDVCGFCSVPDRLTYSSWWSTSLAYPSCLLSVLLIYMSRASKGQVRVGTARYLARNIWSSGLQASNWTSRSLEKKKRSKRPTFYPACSVWFQRCRAAVLPRGGRCFNPDAGSAHGRRPRRHLWAVAGNSSYAGVRGVLLLPADGHCLHANGIHQPSNLQVGWNSAGFWL